MNILKNKHFQAWILAPLGALIIMIFYLLLFSFFEWDIGCLKRCFAYGGMFAGKGIRLYIFIVVMWYIYKLFICKKK